MTLGMDIFPGEVGAALELGEDVQKALRSPTTREALRSAFANHSVILIRGVSLDAASHLALTRVLGEPEIHPVESIRLPDQPEIIEIAHTPTTVAEGSRAGGPDELVGELGWHADLMYMPNPSRGAILRALEVPEEGGETAFLDTTLAFEDLDRSIRRELMGMQAVYRFRGKPFRERNRRADEDRFSEVRHPLVHRVPETDKVALNVSPAAIRIEGLGQEASERLLRELHDHMIQERFMYVHRWQVGDLVVFNNLRALHAAYGHKRKYRRILHRTTLKGQSLEAVAV